MVLKRSHNLHNFVRRAWNQIQVTFSTPEGKAGDWEKSSNAHFNSAMIWKKLVFTTYFSSPTKESSIFEAVEVHIELKISPAMEVTNQTVSTERSKIGQAM